MVPLQGQLYGLFEGQILKRALGPAWHDRAETGEANSQKAGSQPSQQDILQPYASTTVQGGTSGDFARLIGYHRSRDSGIEKIRP
jgi:hypothetical protein